MADRKFINPPELAPPVGYTQVVSAGPGRTLYISGQVAYDDQGNIVGPGDLRTQAQQTYANLEIALVAGGATFKDVVKTTHFVVNYTPADLPVLREVRSRHFPPDHPPANTLIGVQALAREGLLIEVEVVAVVEFSDRRMESD